MIDGEPRVVDVDLSEELGREGERQIRSLIKRHAARLEKRGKLLVFQESGELRYGSAIQADILPLLREEGLIASVGVKPTIAFLNKRQMRAIVARSETEAADDLLEKLLDLYDAWEGGALEPARAVESKTPEAKLLDLIASGAKPPAPPLTLDEEDDVDAARLRRDARNGVFEQVPFLVDEARTVRIRYSELARLLGCEIAEVYSVARFHTDWLERVAPLHQRRERGGGWMTYHGEGGFHTATYYTVGQAIAIAVTIVADIDPGAAGVGLALRQDRHRGIVAMEPFGRHDMVLDQAMERPQDRGAGADMVGQR